MKLSDLPLFEQVFESGAEDRVFDSLLLLGPLLILLIVGLGRTPVTVGITAVYLVFFAAYVLYRGVR